MRPRVVDLRGSRPFRALLPSLGATCYKGRQPLRGIEATRRKALKMFILIDNYDSFTYNLYHFLGELGANVEVRRNDQLSAADVMAMRPQGIVLSPGPCDPDRTGICLDLIKAAAGNPPIPRLRLPHH